MSPPESDYEITGVGWRLLSHTIARKSVEQNYVVSRPFLKLKLYVSSIGRRIHWNAGYGYSFWFAP